MGITEDVLKCIVTPNAKQLSKEYSYSQFIKYILQSHCGFMHFLVSPRQIGNTTFSKEGDCTPRLMSHTPQMDEPTQIMGESV